MAPIGVEEELTGAGGGDGGAGGEGLGLGGGGDGGQGFSLEQPVQVCSRKADRKDVEAGRQR